MGNADPRDNECEHGKVENTQWRSEAWRCSEPTPWSGWMPGATHWFEDSIFVFQNYFYWIPTSDIDDGWMPGVTTAPSPLLLSHRHATEKVQGWWRLRVNALVSASAQVFITWIGENGINYHANTIYIMVLYFTWPGYRSYSLRNLGSVSLLFYRAICCVASLERTNRIFICVVRFTSFVFMCRVDIWYPSVVSFGYLIYFHLVYATTPGLFFLCSENIMKHLEDMRRTTIGKH